MYFTSRVLAVSSSRTDVCVQHSQNVLLLVYLTIAIFFPFVGGPVAGAF